MVPLIKSLVAALREELEQYGEMLARLDDQQELVMRREADGVLQSVEEQLAGLGRDSCGPLSAGSCWSGWPARSGRENRSSWPV